MKYKRIIGIDPGAKGALAFIDTGRPALMPILHCIKNTMPHEALADAMVGAASGECVAYLERVGGFIAGKRLPGSHMFKLGESFGYWQGLLCACHIRCVLVRPQDWQAGVAGVRGKQGGERKRALRAEACRLFPGLHVTLDNCDALLIADYARRAEGM